MREVGLNISTFNSAVDILNLISKYYGTAQLQGNIHSIPDMFQTHPARVLYAYVPCLAKRVWH